jgi:tetratricopeptide (TPR) repeat protein
MTFLRTTTLVALVGLAFSTAGCGNKSKVESLAEEDRQNPVLVFQKGIEYLKTPGEDGEPQYEMAYEQFVSSASLKPDPKVHFNAAWAAERMGKLDDAEKHYRKAWELEPSYDKAMFSLARILNEENKHEEAVAVYEKALETRGDDTDLRTDYIQALTRAGQFEKAEQEAQAILRKDPDNAAVYRSLSSMYFAQGKLGMAQLCNEKALQITDADPGIYNNMGVTYVLQEDPERAIERFKTATKLDPKNFEANMNLGYIALDSGDYGLALNSFQNATAADPTSVDAMLGLAVAKRGSGDFDGADELYQDIILADPKNDLAYFNAATLHEKYTKDFKQAEKYLDAFIDAHVGEIGPNHVVYERKTRIQASIEEERKRQEELARLERERKEREERNKKLLDDMAAQVSTLQAKAAQCSDPMVQEQAMMIIEQANMVIETNDASMAGDLKTFLDDAALQVEACVGGGGEGEAAPEGGEAGGAEGGEASPE